MEGAEHRSCLERRILLRVQRRSGKVLGSAESPLLTPPPPEDAGVPWTEGERQAPLRRSDVDNQGGADHLHSQFRCKGPRKPSRRCRHGSSRDQERNTQPQ